MEVEAYLVQAQTLEGLSGSPVFIQQFSQIPGLSTPGGGGVAGYGDQKLLGIYQGAWDGEPGAILSADRNLKGDNLRVPVGMGIIVQGERILELVKNDPTFKEIQDDVRPVSYTHLLRAAHRRRQRRARGSARWCRRRRQRQGFPARAC